MRKILVVDDEPLNGSMLRELLSMVGFHAVAAKSTEVQTMSISMKIEETPLPKRKTTIRPSMTTPRRFE